MWWVGKNKYKIIIELIQWVLNPMWKYGRRWFGFSLKFATYNTSCIHLFYLMQASQSFSERLLLLMMKNNNNNKKWPLVAMLTCCKYLTCLKCGDRILAQQEAGGLYRGGRGWGGEDRYTMMGEVACTKSGRARFICLECLTGSTQLETPPHFCHCVYVMLLVLNSFITI